MYDKVAAALRSCVAVGDEQKQKQKQENVSEAQLGSVSTVAAQPGDADHFRQDWEGRDCDTVVVPTVQLGALGVRHDQEVTAALLSSRPAASLLCIASGYLNFSGSFLAALLDRGFPCRPIDVLCASPRANGFFGGAVCIRGDMGWVRAG